MKELLWMDGETVGFIGDSITDSGRLMTVDGLGSGYVKRIFEMVAARYPDRRISIVNKGVSGDTVKHLRERWYRDVLQEGFDWLYISIGINDVWRQLDSGGQGAVYLPEYREILDNLVGESKAAGIRVVLLETSIIGEDLESNGNKLLRPYNEAIHQIAVKRRLDPVVPINQAFRRSLRERPELRLTTDGVHPTSYGHMVMALTVLESAGW